MIGKRLFHLINDLERGEKVLLHSLCKKNEDFRFKAFKQLLETKFNSEESYKYALSLLDHFFSHLPDKTKALRRFTDFACKEIENLRIRQHIENNPHIKAFLLADVFNQRNSAILFNHYSQNAKDILSDTNEWFLKSEIIDYEIKWLTRGQLKEDFIKLKTAIIKKNEYNQYNYYEHLVSHYSTISAIFLDDSQDKDFFENLKLTDLELEEYIRKSPSPYYSAQFCLARARFAFREENTLRRLLERAESFLEQLDNKQDIEYRRIRRSINYVWILTIFNYGGDLKATISLSELIIQTNQTYHYKDSISYFLHILLLMLDEQWKRVEELQNLQNSFYFDGSNEVYPQFLMGFEWFLKGRKKEALLIFNDLSYSKSHYIAVWSKLLVMKMHSDLGNMRLLKNLLDRTNYYLIQNKDKLFLHQPSSKLISIYQSFINKKPIENPKNIFCFFRKLLPVSNGAK
jgi:hypothetical protein